MGYRAPLPDALPQSWGALIGRIRRERRIAARRSRPGRFAPYDRATDRGGEIRRGA